MVWWEGELPPDPALLLVPGHLRDVGQQAGQPRQVAPADAVFYRYLKKMIYFITL